MITIVFTNDCDKYDMDSFVEIHKFFKDNNIPFADSFFVDGLDRLSFESAPALIMDYYNRGEIEVIHGFKSLDRRVIRKWLKKLELHGIKVKIFVNHGSNSVFKTNMGIDGDNLESKSYITDLLRDYGIKYISTNQLYYVGDKGMLFENRMRDGSKFMDFQRITYKKPNKRTRTCTFQYLPLLFSRKNIRRMKSTSGLYFTYIHMARNKYPLTERVKKCIFRLASDPEIRIMTPLQALEEYDE